MEEIKAPKKERKFLKAVGNIAKVLANELVMGIARKFIGKAIDKIGNKRQGLVIAFALVAGISYASIDSIPYPVTGNKQRLGWQTSGNGLVYRGRSNDTITKPLSYVDKNVKAYLLLDSVKGTIFVWRQTYWDSILVGGGTTFDTSTLNLVNRFAQKVDISDTADMLLPYFRDTDTSILNLQNRFNLKLNISDTTDMLLPYATKAYADTTGRLYARQDYTTGVTSSTLTWTQSDTLIPGGVTFVQVYRNGQILLPSQYTIPTSTSIVIAASSFKVGENYTVIFPRGGGAGSGGGSGSLTSISAGTGITVSPDPITTIGVVSANLSVLMELTDTSLLNLTSRFASKLNTTDTASLSSRINAKGNGTVESVATAYGLTGGTITTTGTLRVDSNTVYNYVRDSIVKVRIGNDTIKILKQEYNNVTSDTLVWTTTVKFPIQLRSYILLFRNGQLLINDQFSIIDTNKIKVAASSYKLGENYTLVTVSGIGSAGVSQTGNPVYPEAGIALSTGTTWASSIPNNSTNWNTAFTDRLKWDGGSTGLTPSTGRTSLGGTTIGQSMFTLTNPSAITFPRFNDDNTITARSAANFRSDIGAGSVTTVIVAAGTPLSIQNNTTTPEISMAAASGSVNGYLLSTDWTTFNGKQNNITPGTTGQYFRGDKSFQTLDKTAVGLSDVDNTSDAGKPISTLTQTALNGKENTITSGTTGQYFRGDKTFQTLDKSAVGLGNVDNTSDANKPISTATQTALNAKQNTLSGTGFVKASGTTISYDNSTYLTTGTAASTYLPLIGGTVSGTINRQEGSNDGSTSTFYYNILNYFAKRDNNKGGQTAQITFTDRPGTATFENNVRTSDIYLMTAKNFSGGQLGQYLDTTLSVVANQDGGRIGISKLNPAYKLDVNGTFNASGASLIGGTLGVTGATTLGSTLAVTGNITEGGNNVLTNLDTASLSTRIDSKYNSSGGTILGKAILNDSARFEGNVLFKKNMGLPIVKISNANYTATTANHTIIYTVLTADKTLTIPNASDAIGIKYIISIFDIPEGNEALTLVTPSSNLFVRTDGESSNVDIVGGYCTTIQSDGTKWYILSYAPMY